MVGRTERNYLIDFCVTYICEDDRPLSEIEMEAVIEGRIAVFDARGFKLGLYYNNLSKQSFKRLVNAIEKAVEKRRYYKKIVSDLKPKFNILKEPEDPHQARWRKGAMHYEE